MNAEVAHVEPAISVNGLIKRYEDTTAVSGVSFTVLAGEIFGIVGTNGAGKTTTVECLAGLRSADDGELRVVGLDPNKRADRRAIRQRIGVQLQHAALPARLKVWEALDLYASFYRRPADWRNLANEWGLTDKWQSAFQNLSGGERQRLFIALALVGNPQLIFLDELTTGLDPQARRDTWQLVERLRVLGKTVVLVTHYLEEAERLCDRIAVFTNGHIAAVGRPTEVVRQGAGTHRVTFCVPADIPLDFVNSVPGVRSVMRRTDRVVVLGDTDDLSGRIKAALAEHDITDVELQLSAATLDDAFLALVNPACG